MRKLKNVIFASSIVALGLGLTACKEESRNTVVPYNNISASTVVAKLGNDITISQKELYDRLKYNYGQTVFNKKIDSIIYKEELESVKYEGQVKIDIDEKICEEVYGTSDLKELKLKKADDLELARKKFVTNKSKNGLDINENELIFDEITKQTENVSFSNLSQSTIDFYKLEPAKKEAGIEYITSICDKEFLEKEDNKLEKNSYYINDDKIEARYESNYRKYNTSTGVVLRFNSLKQANDAINDCIQSGNSLTNMKEFYVALYNDYYKYEDEKLTATTIGVNENTIFKTNDEVKQLDDFSPNLTKFFTETLEDGQGLSQPINIDDKYYLVYRDSVTYLNGSSKDLTFNQLKTELGETRFNEIKKELKEDIIEADALNVSSTIYSKELEDLNIRIYDPYLENSFAGSNSFYEYVTDSNNEYVFTAEGINYKVEDFYNELLTYDVNETIVNLVTNKYLTHNHNSYLEEDQEKNISKELDQEIKDFKKGIKSLNKAYGEENYLFSVYGFYTKNEVLTSKLANEIKPKYLNDIISNSWATSDNKINEGNLNILNNLIESSLEVIKDKKLFDINIDHILISIDNNQDGNPDNMLEFVNELPEAEKVKFEEALSKLSHAIADEVALIDRDNTMEKLEYIVTAFNKGYKIQSSANNETWDDLKTYNFTLKAEALGDVDEASVENYVEEFKEYIIDMFEKAVSEELEIPEDKENDGRLYFPQKNVTSENFEVKDLCLTEFGYHMVSLNSYEKDSTELNFKFTKEQDTSNDYSNIRLTLDEKDEENEDDDIYIITDIYNDSKEKPSLNQVLVYFVEKANGEVTSIKTSIKNSLSTLLDEVINKYKSTEFQQYLLLNTMGNIEGINLKEFDYNKYKSILKDTNENYDDESYYYNNWYDNSKFDWTRK